MFALIKREIRDYFLYFIAAVAFSTVLIAFLGTAVYYFDHKESEVYYALSIPVVVILVLGFCAMGVSQMYTDKNKKISAFLFVQPTTRSRIFTAKILTGVLCILTALIPVAIAIVLLNRLLGLPTPIWGDLITDVFTTTFLIAIACYCIGLLTGGTTSKVAPSFGGLCLTIALISMILIKGIGPHAKLLLILIIAASLTRAWQKYLSTSF